MIIHQGETGEKPGTGETGDSFLFPAGHGGEISSLRRTPRRTASQLLSLPPFQLVHKIGFAPRTPSPGRLSQLSQRLLAGGETGDRLRLSSKRPQ